MDWISVIKQTIDYIEKNLMTVENCQEVADYVNYPAMNLQKGFTVLTGYTIGEYIRNRRLYLAALEIHNTKKKIIDIAIDYGYDTPESFTKAFNRFHGVSPSKVRYHKSDIRIFLPIEITLNVIGGDQMKYRVEEKNSIKLIGFSRMFTVDNGQRDIPLFWDEMIEEYYDNNSTDEKHLEIKKAIMDNNIGEFGICIDDGEDNCFRYMIAGEYKGGNVPEELQLYEVEKNQWAIFESYGPLPKALQSVNDYIFRQWLPGNKDYQLSGKYNLEWYDQQVKTDNMNYHSSIWIPVEKKED